MNKTFLRCVSTLAFALFMCALAGPKGSASSSVLVTSTAITQFPELWSEQSGPGPVNSSVLNLALWDDHDKDRDRDRDRDHDRDRGHRKDPDPGPAPVPEPATVLLFGAALLVGGTIFRRRYRTVHK